MLNLWTCHPANCSSLPIANHEMTPGLAAHAISVNAVRASNDPRSSRSCSARNRHTPPVYQRIAIAPIKTRNMRISCSPVFILRCFAMCLRYSLRLNPSGNRIQDLFLSSIDGQNQGLKGQFQSHIIGFCVPFCLSFLQATSKQHSFLSFIRFPCFVFFLFIQRASAQLPSALAR